MDAAERENVLGWFRIGYGWLPTSAPITPTTGQNANTEDSPVWETIRQLLRQIENARNHNEPNTHWSISRRLELLIKDTENPTEKGRIYLEWGVIETQIGDHRDGLMKLRSALELYAGKPEEHAILMFLIGCVEWLIPEQMNQTISSLGKAVKEFNLLQKRYSTDDQKVSAYRTHEGQTKEILRAIINTERFPPAPGQAEAGTAAEIGGLGGGGEGPGPVGPIGGTDGPEAPLYWDALRVWPVSERIPAGGFGPLGVDPHPMGNVYLPLVKINDEDYTIRSLVTGSHILNLRTIGDYFVARVIGDSMNMLEPYPLIEGDFVLVRRQEDANHMDVVVVARRDIETLATIKRYYSSDGMRAFRPVSSNPIHTPIFLDTHREYAIIGVAVAVFKKGLR